MSKENGGFYTYDGLDATGKSSIVKTLQEDYSGILLRCPPEWMKAYRAKVEHAPIGIRFMFYAVGNLWVDKMFLQPQMEKQPEQLFLQDRSWLTTLVSHENRGIAPVWLRIGEQLAKQGTKPDTAFIIHVDRDERERRMMSRGEITDSDRLNLKYDREFDIKYIDWAARLDWKSTLFDNTHFSKDEACGILSQQMHLKK